MAAARSVPAVLELLVLPPPQPLLLARGPLRTLPLVQLIGRPVPPPGASAASLRSRLPSCGFPIAPKLGDLQCANLRFHHLEI